jgi:hypothetical protein
MCFFTLLVIICQPMYTCYSSFTFPGAVIILTEGNGNLAMGLSFYATQITLLKAKPVLFPNVPQRFFYAIVKCSAAWRICWTARISFQSLWYSVTAEYSK